MNPFGRKLSCICTSLVLILVALFGTIGAAPAHGQTPPTIDGNLTDMIQFVQDVDERHGLRSLDR